MGAPAALCVGNGISNISQKFLEEHFRVACCGTSAGVGELGSPQEAQVACARPHRLGVPEAEARGEVVRLERLVAVDGEVAAAVVGAVHPDLTEEGWGCGGIFMSVRDYIWSIWPSSKVTKVQA